MEQQPKSNTGQGVQPAKREPKLAWRRPTVTFVQIHISTQQTSLPDAAAADKL